MEEPVTSLPFKTLSSSDLNTSPGFQSDMGFNFPLDGKNVQSLKEKGSNHHLNKWYTSMQSAFEADLQDLRAALQVEFQTKLEQEQKKHAETLNELQDLYSKAQTHLTKLKKQMEWKKEVMTLLCDRCVQTYQFKLQSWVYFVWKQKYQFVQLQQWKYQLATKFHTQWVQRKVVWKLRNHVVVTWRQAFEKRIRNEAETCIAATSQKYEDKLTDLTQQLHHLEKSKREEEFKLKHKEEETKKAFLRGLSILNMETMSVLKPSSESKEEEPKSEQVFHPSSFNASQLEMNSTLPLSSLKDAESVYKESIQALSPFYSKFHSSLSSTPKSSSPPFPFPFPFPVPTSSSSVWIPSNDPIHSSSLYQEMQSMPSTSFQPQSPFSPSLQKKITLSPPLLPVSTSPSLPTTKMTSSSSSSSSSSTNPTFSPSPIKEKKPMSLSFPKKSIRTTFTSIPSKLPVYVSTRGKVNPSVFVTRHAPPSIGSEE